MDYVNETNDATLTDVKCVKNRYPLCYDKSYLPRSMILTRKIIFFKKCRYIKKTTWKECLSEVLKTMLLS